MREEGICVNPTEPHATRKIRQRRQRTTVNGGALSEETLSISKMPKYIESSYSLNDVSTQHASHTAHNTTNCAFCLPVWPFSCWCIWLETQSRESDVVSCSHAPLWTSFPSRYARNFFFFSSLSLFLFVFLSCLAFLHQGHSQRHTSSFPFSSPESLLAKIHFRAALAQFS